MIQIRQKKEKKKKLTPSIFKHSVLRVGSLWSTAACLAFNYKALGHIKPFISKFHSKSGLVKAVLPCYEAKGTEQNESRNEEGGIKRKNIWNAQARKIYVIISDPEKSKGMFWTDPGGLSPFPPLSTATHPGSSCQTEQHEPHSFLFLFSFSEVAEQTEACA